MMSDGSLCSSCMNRVEYCLCVDDDYGVKLPETRERIATLQRKLEEARRECDEALDLLEMAYPPVDEEVEGEWWGRMEALSASREPDALASKEGEPVINEELSYEELRALCDKLHGVNAELRAALEAAESSIVTFMAVHNYPQDSGASDILKQVRAALSASRKEGEK